jgi:predicted Zn-ribbon and HTH transcriptional regulator
MKSREKYGVVMLPTEKAGIGMITIYHTKFPYDFDLVPELNKLSITVNKTAGGLKYDDYYKNQHLYFTSNEEIKEEEYGYDGHEIFKCHKWDKEFTKQDPNTILAKFGDGEILERKRVSCRKVIATTDRTLGILQPDAVTPPSETPQHNEFNEFTIIEVKFMLPKIPESFIQSYIKSHNEGKAITEVDLVVELIQCKHCSDFYFKKNYKDCPACQGESLVNPVYKIKINPDNTITIYEEQ